MKSRKLIAAGALLACFVSGGFATQKRIGAEPQSATVRGELSYPSEGIPPDVIVCAENLKTGNTYCTNKHIQSRAYKTKYGYELVLQPGSYFVFATFPHDSVELKSIPDMRGYRAYYSEYVKCMNKTNSRNPDLDCPSHRPIRVTLRAGQTVDGIDPGDWYNH